MEGEEDQISVRREGAKRFGGAGARVGKLSEGAVVLPAGWVVDENGALRRETIHHMGRRLPGWDYRRLAR